MSFYKNSRNNTIDNIQLNTIDVNNLSASTTINLPNSNKRMTNTSNDCTTGNPCSINCAGDLSCNVLFCTASTIGNPTYNTRSVGTKIVLNPSISSTTLDTAIGMSQLSSGNFSSTMWFSVPTTESNFSWYGGTSKIAQLDFTNGLSCGSIIASSSSTIANTVIDSKCVLPKMSTASRDALSSTLISGYMIYNTSTNKINFYNGSAWVAVTSS